MGCLTDSTELGDAVIRVALAALAVTACAPAADTACGLIAGDNGLTASELQEVESRLLESLKGSVDSAQACSALNGVVVLTKATASFRHPDGDTVTGYANCRERTVTVGTPVSGQWRHGALAHELMHVVQDCAAVQPVDPGLDVDHANWTRDGLWTAIDNVNDPMWLAISKIPKVVPTNATLTKE